MRSVGFKAMLIFMMAGCSSVSQENTITDEKIEVFSKYENTTVEATSGYFNVKENPNSSSSRLIRLKYAHLKSLSPNPRPPVFFTEAGNDLSTWQTDNPIDLTDWVEILKVSDLVFVDRRGADDKLLNYIWDSVFPKGYMLSENIALEHQ